MLFNKKIAKSVGLFNEDLFWDEDIDFCRKLSDKIIRYFTIQKPKIVHYGGKVITGANY